MDTFCVFPDLFQQFFLGVIDPFPEAGIPEIPAPEFWHADPPPLRGKDREEYIIFLKY
jgi:hypothetical protein